MTPHERGTFYTLAVVCERVAKLKRLSSNNCMGRNSWMKLQNEPTLTFHFYVWEDGNMLVKVGM